MGKAVLVIADRNFQDLEYLETKKALEKKGVLTKTASKTLGSKKGVFGSEVNVDIPLRDIHVQDFDGIVFIGGGGAQKYINDKEAMNLSRDFFKAQRITAAICIAPLILASSGILLGKKVTVWDGGEGNQIALIERSGGIFVPENVVKDGILITANGPDAAREFGEKIGESLK